MLIFWAAAWDFQQVDILTSVSSDEPRLPSFKLRNSKWYSVSSLTTMEYSSDLQRLWSDCAYAQADLRLSWSHIPHCLKSHALAHLAWLLWVCIWQGRFKITNEYDLWFIGRVFCDEVQWFCRLVYHWLEATVHSRYLGSKKPLVGFYHYITIG